MVSKIYMLKYYSSLEWQNLPVGCSQGVTQGHFLNKFVSKLKGRRLQKSSSNDDFEKRTYIHWTFRAAFLVTENLFIKKNSKLRNWKFQIFSQTFSRVIFFRKTINVNKGYVMFTCDDVISLYDL